MKKETLYICTRCGKQEMNEPGLSPKSCTTCKSEGHKSGTFVEISVAAQSTIKEKTHIPGIGRANVTYSTEAVQDLKFQQAAIKKYRSSEPTPEEIELWNKINDRGAFGNIRTPDPTEDEIEDWSHYHQLFSKMTPKSFQDVKDKYQMKFFRDYNWWDDDEDDDDEE